MTKSGFDAASAKRFWEKVDIRGQEECWPWLGSTDGRYGSFWHRGKKVKASRFSLALKIGAPLESGQYACHHCDNPICVNPGHLFVGSLSDNTRDAVRKGRINVAAMQSKNHNREKTHCHRGHELSGWNLMAKANARSCRECQLMHNRNYEQRKRARAALGEPQ